MEEREKPGGDHEREGGCPGPLAKVRGGLNRRHDNRPEKGAADATADVSCCRTRPDSMNS